jgi:drug/metabolite transporter (DMT)-like permease
MSLIFALVGYAFQAVDSVLNKYVLEKTTVRPALFTFYSSIFTLPLFILTIWFPRMYTNPFDLAVAALSGVFFALALFVMYRAIQESEISHIGPFLGAAVPFFVLFSSRIFLGEAIGSRVLVGIIFLIIGSFIISLERSRAHHGWHRGMLLAVLAACLFALSHVSAKYLYDEYGFVSGFIYTRACSGLVGLALLATASVRGSMFAGKKTTQAETKKSGTLVVVIEKGVGVIGVVLLQYATALGSVTVVTALAGVQFALLVALVAFLSRFFPQAFKEEYESREVMQEVLGVCVIAVGLMLVVR